MRCLIVFAALSLAACATVPPRAPPVHSEGGIPFDGNSEIGSFADGVADPHGGRRGTIDDPVSVASVSKMVTAIAVIKLIDEGKPELTTESSGWPGWRY